MHITERIMRVRKLTPAADMMPWRVGKNQNILDADGNRIFEAVRFSDTVGVHPSNDVNAEIVEHLTHIGMQRVSDFGKLEPTISELQDMVNSQADRLFPKRTPPKAFLKLFEELGETIKKPEDDDEWADVFLLLLDLSKMHNIDIAAAVVKKMAINDGRVWTETTTGTYQHNEVLA